MKADRFTIKIKKMKKRGKIAPPSKTHKDKKNSYDRKKFKLFDSCD